MDYINESLRLHGQWKGTVHVAAIVPVATKDDLFRHILPALPSLV